MTNTNRASNAKILFVDDERPILRAMNRFARSHGWQVSVAESGEEALDILEDEDFDVVISDMRMPGMSGAAFLHHALEVRPDTVRILLTGYSDIDALSKAINEAKIFNYITKPWNDEMLSEVIQGAIRYKNMEADKQALLIENAEQSRKLGRLALLLDKKAKEKTIEVQQALGLVDIVSNQSEQRFLDSLKVLNHVVEWKEGRDSGHSRFILDYGEKLAVQLGFSETEIDNTRIAAMLHRVGMLCLPDELRDNPIYSFNSEQKELFLKHPEWGEAALSSSPSLTSIAKIIRHQYEYVNGNGHPDRLVLDQIPKESKILAIAGDFYDLYNGRLEKNLGGVEAAREYMSVWKGKKYDSEMIDVFLEVIGDFGASCWKRKSINSEALANGMILDEDVISKKGVLLLTKNTQLNEVNIEKILDYEKAHKEVFEIHVAIDECETADEQTLDQDGKPEEIASENNLQNPIGSHKEDQV